MSVIKKLVLFVCVGLMPVKSLAVRLEDLVTNTGIVAGALICANCACRIFFDGQSEFIFDEMTFFYVSLVGLAGCTYKLGRKTYNFFKPNQKNKNVS